MRTHWIAPFALLGTGACLLHSYLSNSTIWAIPMLAFTALMAPASPKRFDPLLLLLGVAGMGLALMAPVRTAFFLAWWTMLCLLLFEGKEGKLFWASGLLCSPLAVHIIKATSVPLRIHLGDWTATLLQMAGLSLQAQGNLIIWGERQFLVDEGCAGMNMLTFSLLLALALAAFYRKQKQLFLPWWRLGAWFCIAVALNLLSNICRIALLVLLQIPAGTSMHSAVGLLVLLMYVGLPLYWLFPYVGISAPSANESPSPKPLLSTNLAVLSIAVLFISYYRIQHYEPQKAHYELQGFVKKQMQDGVQQFQKNDALVYIKPLAAFYHVEHNPMICWTGSGYALQQVEKQEIGGCEVFTGKLVKGDDAIYTSWWFNVGGKVQTGYMSWRWESLLHPERKMAIVNVNASTPEKLETQTAAIIASMGP